MKAIYLNISSQKLRAGLLSETKLANCTLVAMYPVFSRLITQFNPANTSKS